MPESIPIASFVLPPLPLSPTESAQDGERRWLAESLSSVRGSRALPAIETGIMDQLCQLFRLLGDVILFPITKRFGHNQYEVPE